jgi:hypothetical protein
MQLGYTENNIGRLFEQYFALKFSLGCPGLRAPVFLNNLQQVLALLFTLGDLGVEGLDQGDSSLRRVVDDSESSNDSNASLEILILKPRLRIFGQETILDFETFEEEL